MPAAVGGYVLKDGLVTVEGTAYSNQCKTIMLTPSQDTQTYRTIVPDGTKQDVDTAVWALTLAGLQDYAAARGLARLLTDNAGEKLAVVLTPDNGQGVSATVTVTAKAVPFGGDTGSWAEFSVELPVDGKPVFS